MDPITAMIVQAIIGFLISAAVAGIQSMLQTAEATPKDPNLEGEETRGGDEPFSFILGTYASAGHFNYHGSWGVSGGPQTAFYTKEIGYSDLTITAFIGAIVDDQYVTLNQSTGLIDKGYPIAEKNDGVDNFWMRTYLGDQTTADPLLVSKFSGDANRPYGLDRVGEDIAKVVFTARTNRKIFPRFPKLKMVMQGIPLYDITKDTTAGGSGSHRWGMQSTYEFSDNIAVMIYNVLRGIHNKNGVRVYGGGYEDWQLPYDVFSTAIGVCNQDVPLLGGGTEKRYRAGANVKGSKQPDVLIQTLLNCGSGRIAESRGKINLVMGPPLAAIATITDDDFEVLENSQTLDLLSSINKTKNSMTASYACPEENWTLKQLPTIESATYLAEDDGFSRPASLDLSNVFSNTQSQRVMLTALNDNRRVRIHAGTLPPKFMGLQVYDTIEWTSSREQYTAKKFEIIAIDDTPNALQAVVLREVETTDFDFDPAIDEQGFAFVSLTPTAPVSQVITSWSAVPIKFTGADGRQSLGITIGWDNSADVVLDVRFVRVEVRLKSTGVLVFERADIDPESGTATISSPAFLSDTEYEARAKFDPYSARSTDWSGWLTVKTGIVSIGLIDIDQAFANMNEFLGQSLWQMLEEQAQSDDNASDDIWERFSDKQELRTDISSATGEVTVSYELAIIAATGPTSSLSMRTEVLENEMPNKAALTITDLLSGRIDDNDGKLTVNADAITALQGVVGYDTGSATMRMNIGYTPSAGWTSRIGFQARVSSGDSWQDAGLFMEATASGSQIVLSADTTVIGNGASTSDLFVTGTTNLNNANITNLTATNILAKSIDADVILIDGSLVEDLIADGAISLASSSKKGEIDLTNTTTITTLFTDTTSIKSGKLIIILNGVLTVRIFNSAAWGTYRFYLYVAGDLISTTDVAYDENGSIKQDGIILFNGEKSVAATTTTVQVRYAKISGSGAYAKVKDMSWAIWSSSK